MRHEVPQVGLRAVQFRRTVLAKASRSPIIVFDSDDIILTKITPGLHLDQFQIDLPRIFQAVLRPDWNVGRFIFINVWVSSPVVTQAEPRTTIQCARAVHAPSR